MQHLWNSSSCDCQQNMDPDSRNASDLMRPFSTLEIVANFYMSVHGILSLVVCAFGIPMNLLNITILTRKHMRTPVNCILTWLAVFDLLTMTSYVPFSLHFYCLTWNMSAERNSLGWMTFLIFHVDLTSTTHTISIWLGVTLAMFRYKHIFSPAKGHLTRVRRLIRARIAVFVMVVLSVLIMIPNYLMNQLKSFQHFNTETNATETIFVTEPLNMETPDVKPLAQVNLLLHSALAKFLPCILMVVYGGLLVKTLRTNIRMLPRHTTGRNSDSYYPPCNKEAPSFHHQGSQTNNTTTNVKDSVEDQKANAEGQPSSTTGDSDMLCVRCSSQIEAGTSNNTTIVYLSKSSTSTVKAQKQRRSSTVELVSTGRSHLTRHHDNSRTTRMLLVVITLFLVTELPQAILIVLSATIPGFFMDVYVPLGDIMDMVALVNNGINFLLYCIMSRDFRTTLIDLVKTIMDRVSVVYVRMTTNFRRPTLTVIEQTERSHATLIVRVGDFHS